MDGKSGPSVAGTRHPWLVAAAAAGTLLLLAGSPLLLKAPTAGVAQLCAQLESGSSSDLSRQVSAQTLRLLFAGQPWARPQISARAASLPLASLLRSGSPAVVEHTACLVADLHVFNYSAVPEGLDLAGLLPRKTCSAACQKCAISSLGRAPPPPASWAFPRDTQELLLQWAGLLALEDVAALRLLSYQASTAAAALVINQAATPAGRAAITGPGLVPALQAALQLSALPRHVITAARAARLLGNLAQDERFVAQLHATHDLEPLLKVGLRCNRPSWRGLLEASLHARLAWQGAPRWPAAPAVCHPSLLICCAAGADAPHCCAGARDAAGVRNCAQQPGSGQQAGQAGPAGHARPQQLGGCGPGQQLGRRAHGAAAGSAGHLPGGPRCLHLEAVPRT